MSFPSSPLVLLPVVVGARLATAEGSQLLAATCVSVALYAVLTVVCVLAGRYRRAKEDGRERCARR
jgi:hypothetical protein